MSPETLMHYAMLIRLIMIMAIGAFGVGIAILVPVLRRWAGSASGHQPHERVGVAMRDLGPVGR